MLNYWPSSRPDSVLARFAMSGGEVEDHSKASGLEPHGAQAVGLVWRGESGDINQRASNEGHSRQAVVLSIAEAQPTLHEQSE